MKKIILIIFFLYVNQLYGNQVYHFDLYKDISIITPSVLLLSYSFLKQSQMDELKIDDINHLSKDAVNRFDRIAVNNFSSKSSFISDCILTTCLLAPFTFNLNSDIDPNVNLIIVEAYLVTASLTSFSKVMFQRKRPFVYNDSVENEIRLSKDGQLSFFSGHTALAFTGTILTAKIFDDHYQNKYNFFIYSSATITASTVGYLRFSAGKHYPTDIIVGAIVGTGVALLIPQVHKTHLNNNELRTIPLFNYGVSF